MKSVDDLKNSSFDRIAFILYHAIVIIGSLFLFVTITADINEFDFKTFKFKKKKIEQEIATTTSVPVIEKVKGTVTISATGKSSHPAAVGEELQQGSIIETAENSFALLTFSEKYTCRIKVGAKSRLDVDELLVQNVSTKTEDTTINLKLGNVIVHLLNKNEPVKIQVRTTSASFGVRGTKLAVFTDGSAEAMLCVEHGQVEAENKLNFKRSRINGGESYYIDKDGQDRKENNPQMINALDWNMDGDLPVLLVLSELKEKLTSTSVVIQQVSESGVQSEVTPEMLASIEQEIKIFKEENIKLLEEVEVEKHSIAKYQADLEKDLVKINEDIHCLETSTVRCKLFTENILIKRGFPQTYGAPKLIESMTKDLKAYIEERNQEISDKQKDFVVLETLIKKRQEVLQVVETQLLNKTELNSIIPKLKEQALHR